MYWCKSQFWLCLKLWGVDRVLYYCNWILKESLITGELLEQNFSYLYQFHKKNHNFSLHFLYENPFQALKMADVINFSIKITPFLIGRHVGMTMRFSNETPWCFDDKIRKIQSNHIQKSKTQTKYREMHRRRFKIFKFSPFLTKNHFKKI